MPHVWVRSRQVYFNLFANASKIQSRFIFTLARRKLKEIAKPRPIGMHRVSRAPNNAESALREQRIPVINVQYLILPISNGASRGEKLGKGYTEKMGLLILTIL